MKKYKHIFFDLDRTLWDFDKNSALTLYDILDEFNLRNIVPDQDSFALKYHFHNEEVWKMYRNQEISKNELRIERFRRLLNGFNLRNEDLTRKISNYYILQSPRKNLLIKGAKEILDYLENKYALYVISNGFYEAQLQKLKSSSISKYFSRVFTSEKTGCAKPSKTFFEYALKTCNARKKESIVIGDDFIIDIMGAKSFGLDQIWYNPHDKTAPEKVCYTVRYLAEISNVL